jgi:hypothetical protein
MSDSTLLFIILGAIIALCTLALVFLCCYRRCKGVPETSSVAIGTASSTTLTRKHAIAANDLIPPLFFTEQMTDRLLQEDLREHVHDPSNAPYV